MAEVIAFLNSIWSMLTMFTFGGIPIVFILLGCAMLRLILKAVTRTIDGGTSNDSD